MNKLRYKDGKGDPRGFKTFLAKEFTLTLIPRYRGNRLHVMYTYCKVFLERYDALASFFAGEHGGAEVGQLRRSINHDFRTDTAVAEFVALNFIGELPHGWSPSTEALSNNCRMLQP